MLPDSLNPIYCSLCPERIPSKSKPAKPLVYSLRAKKQFFICSVCATHLSHEMYHKGWTDNFVFSLLMEIAFGKKIPSPKGVKYLRGIACYPICSLNPNPRQKIPYAGNYRVRAPVYFDFRIDWDDSNETQRKDLTFR